MRKKISKIIFSSLENMDLDINIDEKTELFSKNGVLDSLGLVNLLVEIEQEIEDQFDVSVVIADEKAMSQKNSPFKSIDSLVDYIQELINSN